MRAARPRKSRCAAVGLAGLLVVSAGLLGGCAGAPRARVALGGSPYVAVRGTGRELAAGWGVDLHVYRVRSFADLGGRLAFSHHPAEPGQPGAEYIRLGGRIALGSVGKGGIRVSGSRKREGDGGGFCYSVGLGPSVHFLLLDGAGDAFGFGLGIEPEIGYWHRSGFHVLVGFSAEAWVTTGGDFLGAFAPTLRLGFTF